MRTPFDTLRGLAALALPLLVLSCSGDAGGPTGPDPDEVVEVTVSALGLLPVQVGGTLQLEALPRNGLGDAVPGQLIVWESQDEAVVEVDSSGLLTGVGEGTAEVRARVGGRVGAIQVSVELPPPPPLPTAWGGQATSTSEIALTWSWAGGAGDTVRIEREVVPAAAPGAAGAEGGFTEIASVPAELGHFSDLDLTPGTRYRYRLRVCGSVVCSDFSPPVEHTTLALLLLGPPTLPTAVVGHPYAGSLTAMGGDGTYLWSLVAGELPEGITLSAGGALVGTPVQAGSFDLLVEVASGDGQRVEGEYTIEVVSLLQAQTEVLPEGEVGMPYAAELVATGGQPPYAWSLIQGGLPAGLTLNGSLGRIQGIPTALGGVDFTLLVSSADGQSVSVPLTIEVLGEEEVVESSVPVVIENWYLRVGIPGSFYSQQIVVQGGNGSDYDFSVVDGALPGGLSLTPDGVIDGFPSESGTAHFRVRVESGGLSASRVYALSVSTVAASGYNIAIVNASDAIPPFAFQAALDAGVARWEATITSNLPMAQIPAQGISSGSCQGLGSRFRAGEVIEDLAVLLDIAALGGTTVASAGPCGFPHTSGSPVPWVFPTGSMVFNSSFAFSGDVARMAAVVVHELGHIIGIGTLWNIGGRSLLTGAGGSNPRFTGAAARSGYQAAGGPNQDVPVETNQYGAGTADSHWRESVFRQEVMTGFIEASGVHMPFSRMTIGSVADLGYSVNYGAADSYTLPPPGAPSAQAHGEGTPIYLMDDVVIEPYFILLPDGTIEVVDPRR